MRAYEIRVEFECGGHLRRLWKIHSWSRHLQYNIRCRASYSSYAFVVEIESICFSEEIVGVIVPARRLVSQAHEILLFHSS